jgi:hypothetical protein
LFTGKKPSTQRSISSYIDTVCEHCGETSVAYMTRDDVQDIVDLTMEAKPSGARNLLIALRLAMRVAVAEGWRKKGDDPCAEIDLPEITGDGYRTWSDDEAAAYEAGYAVGAPERFVYEMYAWTALRGSDAARMGRRNLVKRKKPLYVMNEVITHDLLVGWQEKTGKPINIPVMPPLQRAIDALPRQEDDSKPFLGDISGKGFRNTLRDAAIAIGLTPKVVDASGRPKGLSGHGLRKRMAVRIVEDCGKGEGHVAAVLGHTDHRLAHKYAKAANEKRMIEDTLCDLYERELSRTKNLHTPDEVLHTVPHPAERKR